MPGTKSQHTVYRTYTFQSFFFIKMIFISYQDTF